MAGMGLVSVKRLVNTWAKVSKKYIKKYQRLEEVFDMSRNSQEYRDRLTNAKPPVIPFLALYAKDLSALQEINPNFISNPQTSGESSILEKLLEAYRNSYEGGREKPEEDNNTITNNNTNNTGGGVGGGGGGSVTSSELIDEIQKMKRLQEATGKLHRRELQQSGDSIPARRKTDGNLQGDGGGGSGGGGGGGGGSGNNKLNRAARRKVSQQRDLVNVEKMRIIWRLVNELKAYQTSCCYDEYFHQMQERRGTVSPRASVRAVVGGGGGGGGGSGSGGGGGSGTSSTTSDTSGSTLTSGDGSTILLTPPAAGSGGAGGEGDLSQELNQYLRDMTPPYTEDQLYDISLCREPRKT